MNFILKVSLLALWIGSADAFGRDGHLSETPRVVPSGLPVLHKSKTKRGLSAFPKSLPPSPPPTYKRVTDGETGKKEWRLVPDPCEPESLGTIVRMKHGMEADLQAAQEMFAECYPKQDPDPMSRSAHFDWVPIYDDHPVHNLGWEARVEEVDRIQDGQYRIVVRLTPRLRSSHIKTLICDFVEETYEIKGKDIRFVGSDAAVPRKHLQKFPVYY